MEIETKINNKLNELIFVAAFFPIFFSGCGVKGKPLPPLTPPYIGSGKQVSQSEVNFPSVSRQKQNFSEKVVNNKLKGRRI